MLNSRAAVFLAFWTPSVLFAVRREQLLAELHDLLFPSSTPMAIIPPSLTDTKPDVSPTLLPVPFSAAATAYSVEVFYVCASYGLLEFCMTLLWSPLVRAPFGMLVLGVHVFMGSVAWWLTLPSRYDSIATPVIPALVAVLLFSIDSQAAAAVKMYDSKDRRLYDRTATAMGSAVALILAMTKIKPRLELQIVTPFLGIFNYAWYVVGVISCHAIHLLVGESPENQVPEMQHDARQAPDDAIAFLVNKDSMQEPYAECSCRLIVWASAVGHVITSTALAATYAHSVIYAGYRAEAQRQAIFFALDLARLIGVLLTQAIKPTQLLARLRFVVVFQLVLLCCAAVVTLIVGVWAMIAPQLGASTLVAFFALLALFAEMGAATSTHPHATRTRAHVLTSTINAASAAAVMLPLFIPVTNALPAMGPAMLYITVVLMICVAICACYRPRGCADLDISV